MLGTLIKVYEDEHYPRLPSSGPGEALRSLMDAGEISQARLSRETGLGESTISEILSGRRRPSLRAITKLSDHFHMDPSYFMGPDAK